MLNRLFVDMDGTLAEFNKVDTLERLYEKDYFLNLKPQMSVVMAVNDIVLNHPEVEVYILSAVLSDSKYARTEKNQWLDKYLPGIDEKHRLYPTCGEDKAFYIRQNLGSISASDYLLDDYSKNLHLWEPPAKGIKLMNGINGNYGTWERDKVNMADGSEAIVNTILEILNRSQNLSVSENIGMVNRRKGR